MQLSASSHLSGNVGVAVFGGYLITAAGSIIGDFGIDGSSHGSIINTGVVSGNVCGVIQKGSVAGDLNTFINSGSTADTTFVGGGGADASGGTGGDYMEGGAGNNTLSYSSSLQGVSINLLAGTASGDYFLNFQNVKG